MMPALTNNIQGEALKKKHDILKLAFSFCSLSPAHTHTLTDRYSHQRHASTPLTLTACQIVDRFWEDTPCNHPSMQKWWIRMHYGRWQWQRYQVGPCSTLWTNINCAHDNLLVSGCWCEVWSSPSRSHVVPPNQTCVDLKHVVLNLSELHSWAETWGEKHFG